MFPWARSGRLFYGCGTLCKGRFGVLRVQLDCVLPSNPGLGKGMVGQRKMPRPHAGALLYHTGEEGGGKCRAGCSCRQRMRSSPPEHTLVALLSEQPPPAPCTKRQQSVPRGLDANAECWDLRAAGEGVRMRGRQQDPRQSKRRNYAAPPANKLSHLRNPCTPSRLAF